MSHKCHMLALGLLALSGCFSIDKASLPKSGEQQIVVSNYGWSLFGCIPLACGNANPESWTPWAIFRDDVTMDKIQQRFFDAANADSSRLKDLSYKTYDTIFLEIPGLEVPLPIPYVLTYREIQLSGVLQ